MNLRRRVHCGYCGPKHQTRAARNDNPGDPLWAFGADAPIRQFVRHPNGLECCAACAAGAKARAARALRDKARRLRRSAA